MTAKEGLLDRVDRRTEDEAADLLAQLDWDATETETLTGEEFAEAEEADRAIRGGDWEDGETVLRQLGL